MVRSNLAYVHGERTCEGFINKLDTKRSNISLDLTRVFIFFLDLDLIYKSIPSLYVPSLYSSLSWLLLISFSWDFLLVRDKYNAGLQYLFIKFYNKTLIWTTRWSWSLNAWWILINYIWSWSPWSRRALNPSIFKNKLLSNRIWILIVLL